MTSATLAKAAASTLIIGAALTGCATAQGGAPASASSSAKAQTLAAKSADRAAKALARQDYAAAVTAAEQAVVSAPDVVAYRAMLAQAYMGGGRFASAEAAFADVLTLDPGNARAPLNLVLAQIANGRNDAALRTLEQYRSVLSAADFGLATALAGDPAGGVRVLEVASRDGRADTKLRQNLALAYALDGKWTNARVMAAQDLSADQLDDRMTQWAQFVRPLSKSQQVASLLGVTPVDDAGMPTRLALRAAQGDAPTAERAPDAVDAVDVAAASLDAVPVFEAAPSVYEVPTAQAAASPAAPVPVAAQAEAPLIRSEPTALKQAVIRPSRAAGFTKAAAAPTGGAKPAPVAQAVAGRESGKFVVQLGAYSSSDRAQAAWAAQVGKAQSLSAYKPATARVAVKSGSLYRLSVSGFVSRDVAGQVCAKVKASGGACFIRSIAGDAPIEWAAAKPGKRSKPVKSAKAAKPAKPVRVASR